ncbi:hypothetical protein HMPREF0758_3679 [Serratia odorifera DSM 4582]|uniref:Uncharacterized protein n=1 Tax=Serratia odorifera DSM 4582 TaxID=667129 RepID=D4E679_SEROD|nr:hypothetical protein HMPREF0758_3679 [Serratia odorifera DSM 4582]
MSQPAADQNLITLYKVVFPTQRLWRRGRIVFLRYYFHQRLKL